jgi:PAS domain S-box-containing protein
MCALANYVVRNLLRTLLLLLSATPALWAHDAVKPISQYVHTSWRTEGDEGLPQNSVQAIVQTKDGYLWLGTQEGLVRFNGARFTTFNNNSTDAIRDNDIRILFKDRQGNLWIGTQGGGLVEYSQRKFGGYSTQNGLSSTNVSAIADDANGNLWVGTDDGLNQFTNGSITHFGVADGLSDSQINALIVDDNGDLWVATNEGLNRIPKARFHAAPIQKFLSRTVVNVLYAGNSGDLWIGTEKQGVYKLSSGKLTHYGSETGLPRAAVRSMFYENSDDVLWVGTGSGGLCRLILSGKSKRADCDTTDGLRDDAVLSILRDHEGSLWVGTQTGGLTRLKDGAFSLLSPSDKPVIAARSMYEGHDGSLWVGTDSGLRRYKDGQVKLYKTSSGSAGNYTFSVIEAHDGSVWMGTKHGLVHQSTSGEQKSYTTRDGLPSDRVHAVLQDHEGAIWVGTARGLSRFANGQFRNFTARDGISTKGVSTLFEDHNHSLWIGNDAGIVLLRDGKFHDVPLSQDGGASSSSVVYFYEDPDHVLWIGTYGSGLVRYKEGKVTRYTRKDGLFDDTVWAILEDDQQNLWMSSNRGIFKASKSELNDFAEARTSRITSVGYGTSDGLPSTECNGESQNPAWKARDGKLLFACVRGVVVVSPEKLKRNLLPPPVVIEEVYLDKEPLNEGSRAPVGRGELEINFAALSYVAPDKVAYKYRLDPNDNDWRDWSLKESKSRGAVYTNLPPGDYRFQVIASNNDGVWNLQGATFSFSLKPYFYQTDWFYALCGLVALGLVGGAYLFRMRQIRKHEEELLVQVNERTRALQQEIVARREMEQALARSAAIVESSSDAIWSTDFAGTILTWNSGAEKLFGYTSPEVVGKSVLMIVPPERTHEVNEYLEQLRHGEFVNNLETVRQTKDGKLLDLSLSVSPISKHGVATGLSVIARDITQRKRAEMVLQQAKDAAEAATRAKSEFLANMSHEIRTPLNGVIGMLDLAAHTDLSPDQDDLLSMAQDSANTLLVVVNDILDFSKIEAGKLEFYSAEFNLAETVAEAIRTIALRAHEKQLELVYYIGADLPRFLIGDAARLKQVLINLVGNAIKFTDHGEVVLRVEAGKPGPDGVEVKFSVSDTGIGIPPEKQKLIFDAFSQADASTTRRFGGTGLGLAICCRIVNLMGGHIWLESHIGKGSTFYFTARFQVAPEISTGKTMQYRSDLQGLPVLIVDDNQTNRHILEQTLAAWGMVTRSAESGPAGLQVLKNVVAGGFSFFAALVDYRMPGMDGFSLVNEIRNVPQLATLPIIILTSDDYHGTAIRCREMGVTAYLIKPVKQSELLSTMHSLLQPAGNRIATAAAREIAPKTSVGTLKILVAEDNHVNQKLVVRLLEKAGHKVMVAATGREALAQSETHPFDVILMDVQMPEMDGLAATRAIRAREQVTGAHVFIIAMTAHAMKGDRERCLESGMDEYLPKPITANDLYEVITRVVQNPVLHTSPQS